MDVKVGDRVLFGKWSGTEVKVNGKLTDSLICFFVSSEMIVDMIFFWILKRFLNHG